MKKLKLDIQRFSSTNKTTHYELSQYVGTDKPTYLVDYNQDMSKIDTGIYNAQAQATINETNIGDLSDLTTTDKLSLVGAINEVNSESSSVGDLQDLTTTSKTSVVSAINEVNGKANNIGDLTNLTTTDKTNVVNAVNEVNAKANTIGNLSNLHTTDKASVVNAINEVDDKAMEIGTLSNLNTTDKSNVVNAINEVLTDIHDIEYGTIGSNEMSSYQVGSQTKRKYEVTFTKTYTQAPIVLATTYNNAITNFGIIDCAVDNITTTGCILIFNENISDARTGINYLVIQK